MDKNNWHTIPWIQCHAVITKIKEQIVMAHINKNYKLAYQLQRKLVCCYEGRCLAIRRVVTNSGATTPGIDKRLCNSSKN